MTYGSVEELLADARSRLARLEPGDVGQAVSAGARLVDIRPEWQRREEGEVPGALIVERNHLEWRLDPACAARVDEAVPGQRWIVICAEGYTSSLAADALNSIGVPATDVVGGFASWRRAGLPSVPGGTQPSGPGRGVHSPSRTDRLRQDEPTAR
ncbi:rhodanese-like domain-containing protein [uncultured Jatrophihabitans sp.]|uniref:rhodanese-like domain-containing protein n=1 Tax=uncultured Jatrophihabitans sp. TaxID=1610747 RepID=UPI0035CBCE59